ncbi:amidohydrolase [Aspergillus clavatus NRRL 1]|uniref:Amidohydrolase family protein n=1 Tax=Aspergillus clavatus (strain ATCC 1007 / CBS 513.65 / DSM 816 / NCTC 3887 / NRRL 1 / QM 1276 / 107) TaxID=344612 RepID=A1C5J6_ASPCL|nr:amidohydrolase family protein [Aspergillus clavatus NRRL 1]EAW14964.1 amidohydrolase family protein [Aspergillus clavatus NRRL 1]
MKTLFTHGHFFAPQSLNAQDDNVFAECLVVENDKIVYVGAQENAPTADDTVDLQNRLVIPGFIDGHVHIMNFGQSLGRLSLLDCTCLEDIRKVIKSFAEAHPSAPRILCRGWMQSSTNGIALASMLDDLDPRPIQIESFDLHSCWCNSAALEEMGVYTAQDPAGGTIHRDENRRPSGLLSENAMMEIVWPFLLKTATLEDMMHALRLAFAAYTEAGYTGLVDMAMEDNMWAVLKPYYEQENPPFHIAAHWLVPFSEDQEANFTHVDRAIQLWHEFNPATSPHFCITGIKLICDGVVDGCTAALTQPYGNRQDPVEPIWPVDMLRAVVQRADAAGLQCAIHAIGDKAVKQAIDVLGEVGTPGRRHRIEHLELTAPEDAKRLGQLGITASVQPVHSDPVILRAWPDLIGPERCQRAFAYKDFAEGGAKLAFGTDAPTAAHLPLPNLYNATTRRSAMEPESSQTTNEHFGLGLAEAVTAATEGAAYARFAENWAGILKEGCRADFVVLDMQWNAEDLLEGKVCETWFAGKRVYATK